MRNCISSDVSLSKHFLSTKFYPEKVFKAHLLAILSAWVSTEINTMINKEDIYSYQFSPHGNQALVLHYVSSRVTYLWT